eukprot:comp20762_c2_seq1/m.27228 comp20762_c2_seq1/g.27228  ORF comp20762_c2_seq1/g.27228 comp20762_c2_seq1/m.27228 type:complete len:425 (-) comp20762_c2_seq1:380-1654(-)
MPGCHKMMSNMRSLARLVVFPTIVAQRPSFYRSVHVAAVSARTAAFGAARTHVWSAGSALVRPTACMSVRHYATKKKTEEKKEETEDEVAEGGEEVKGKKKRVRAAKAKTEPKKKTKSEKETEGKEEEQETPKKKRSRTKKAEAEQAGEKGEKKKGADKQAAVSKTGEEEQEKVNSAPQKFVLEQNARDILAKMPWALTCVETLHGLMPHTNVLLLLTREGELMQVATEDLKERHAEVASRLGGSEVHLLEKFLEKHPSLLLNKGLDMLDKKIEALCEATTANKKDVCHMLLENPDLLENVSKVKSAVEALNSHGIKGSVVEFGPYLHKDFSNQLDRLSKQLDVLRAQRPALMTKAVYPSTLRTHHVLLKGGYPKLYRLAFLRKHDPESAKPEQFAPLCELPEGEFARIFKDYVAFKAGLKAED